MEYLAFKFVAAVVIAFGLGFYSGRTRERIRQRKQAIIDGMTPEVRKSKGL